MSRAPNHRSPDASRASVASPSEEYLRVWWALLPTISLIAVFSAFALLWFVNRDGYALVMRLVGVTPWRLPFVDLWGVLSAIDCHRQGIDVFVENPCDPMQRLHSYSPLWLYLPIPAPVALLIPLGLAAFAAFVAVSAIILRAHTRQEAIMFTLAAVSTSSIFLLERANVDAFIFALLALAACMLSGHFAARALAYGMILSMGLLKFYPVAALLGIARERLSTAAALASVCLLAIGALFAAFPHEMALIPTIVARGQFYHGFFGAKNLPSGLAVVLSADFDQLAAGARDAPKGTATLLFLGMCCVWCIGFLLLTRRLRAIDIGIAERDEHLLLIGSATILGCFFLGQSLNYRIVFLILALPGLVRGGQVERILALTGYGALFFLWADFVSQYIFIFAPRIVCLAFWLTRETLWWALVAALGAVIARYLAHRLPRSIFFMLPSTGR
jgi:hypothetical protein